MSRSPHSGARGSPYRKEIPEGPIHDFATVIENTAPEDWQQRTAAFSTLVATIPSGSDYSARGDAWFNSPPVLRHLAFPLSELLKDARSTVVKRTCDACAELFAKCQSDARYLLKDIMPTVLAVHAQTVQVIRQCVQDMIIEALGVVPCKMAMPVWLDRLKSDKSPKVREACCLYLGVALSSWSLQEGYLSLEIWNQVGTALVKALKDSLPAVRKNARKALEIVHQQMEDVFDQLLQDTDLTRDVRVKKVLQRILAGETVGDDVSVASSRVGGGSVASRGVRAAGTGGGGGGGSVTGMRINANRSPTYYSQPPTGRPTPRTNISSQRGPVGIPKTIGVATTSPSYASSTKSSTTARKTNTGVVGMGPPVRMNNAFKAAVDSPPRITRKNNNGSHNTLQSIDGDLGASFDTTDTADSEMPDMIASANELKLVAKTRNSRRSSLLQERFAKSMSSRSSSNVAADEQEATMLDDILDTDDEMDEEIKALLIAQKAQNASVMPMPEHLKIAHELLENHKRHVDLIMETLKMEMDALKEFEQIVLAEEGRPTEDEVLEYFESVGLCLEQRNKAGLNFQKKMDRISKGNN